MNIFDNHCLVCGSELQYKEFIVNNSDKQDKVYCSYCPKCNINSDNFYNLNNGYNGIFHTGIFHNGIFHTTAGIYQNNIFLNNKNNIELDKC